MNNGCFKIIVQKDDERFHEVYFYTVSQLRHYVKILNQKCIVRIKYFYHDGTNWQKFVLYQGAILTRKKLNELLLTLSA